MSDEDQSGPGVSVESHEAHPKLSARGRQVREILFWVFSPLALVVGASLLALILGAPWFRASIVFALASIGVGAFQLYKNQAWIPFGAVRSGGVIYAGAGALLLALVINASPTSERAVRPDTNAVASATSVPPGGPPAPVTRSIYPWAYTVSPLTVTCENSTAVGEGQVIATAADGRVFAVSDVAQSDDRPSLSSIERRDGDRDEVRQAASDFATAGAALCLGPARAGHQLILSQGTPPPPPPPPPSPWSYRTQSDEMSDRTIAHACTTSTNVVNLGRLYGSQRVTLCLRQHPRWGQDVIVRLERGGQFLCTSYQACTVRVRFDDGEAAAYSALEPSDNSSDTIFITNDVRFIGNLRRSSRVIIEANFYQAGAQRMSFNSAQLEWPPRS